MGEEEVLEVLLEKLCGALANALLDPLGIPADQVIGDEADRAVVDQAVGEEQGATAGLDPQHGVVGADRIHLQRDDVGSEFVAEAEPFHSETLIELVQPRLVAEDRAVEALGELRRVSQMMPVGEHDPLHPAPLEPLDPLVRQQRIDQGPRPDHEVISYLDPDLRVHSLPVNDPVDDLLHKDHATRCQHGPSKHRNVLQPHQLAENLLHEFRAWHGRARGVIRGQGCPANELVQGGNDDRS